MANIANSADRGGTNSDEAAPQPVLVRTQTSCGSVWPICRSISGTSTTGDYSTVPRRGSTAGTAASYRTVARAFSVSRTSQAADTTSRAKGLRNVWPWCGSGQCNVDNSKCLELSRLFRHRTSADANPTAARRSASSHWAGRRVARHRTSMER